MVLIALPILVYVEELEHRLIINVPVVIYSAMIMNGYTLVNICTESSVSLEDLSVHPDTEVTIDIRMEKTGSLKIMIGKIKLRNINYQ